MVSKKNDSLSTGQTLVVSNSKIALNRLFFPNLNSKKGQVTVFIILGILLLMFFSLIYYLTSLTVSTAIETEARPVIETVPQEFVAIQEYTESCLNSISEKGLVILGQQGGYIYPSILGDFSVSNPTDSSGINLNTLLIPYWHFNSLENGESAVSIASFQPSLYNDESAENYYGGAYSSIESQLGKYVEEELESCLKSYDIFQSQNFVVLYSEKTVEARVWDGYVNFVLEMPLEATRDGGSARMTTFYTEVDVDIKHIYEVAASITGVEKNYTFLENQALELLLIHSGEDSSKFVPMHGVSIDDSKFLSWSSDVLERKMKSVLLSYVPMLQYEASKNFLRYEYPSGSLTSLSGALTQKTVDNMILPLTDELVNADDLNIDFSYFGWPIHFDINGGQEKITPTEVFIPIPSPVGFDFSFQKFYNSYDFSYPVLVSLEDPDSLNGLGYTFNLALESNVINNFPIDANYVQPDLVISGADSLVCDEDHFDTGLLKSIVVDAYTKKPIEMVKVGFLIPESGRCNIGLTDSFGEIESNYPSVYGGLMQFYNEDYLKLSLPIDTYSLKGEDALVGMSYGGLDYDVIYMYKKQPVTIKAIKNKLGKCIVPKVCNLDKDKCEEDADRVCFFNSGNGLFLPEEPDYSFISNGSYSFLNEYYFLDSSGSSLGDNEEVLISLELVSPFEESFFIYDDFSAYATVSEFGGSEIDLVPGTYLVTIQTMSDNEVVIPLDTRCAGAKKAKHCRNVSSMTLGTTMTTMAWVDDSTYLIITPEDLYNSDTLTFNVLSLNFDTMPINYTSVDENGGEIVLNSLVVEDLAMMGFSTNISNLPHVRSALEPVWSSSILEDVSNDIGEESEEMLINIFE